MYSNIKSKKTINYGLQILRMLLSFWVVLNHLYKPKNEVLYNTIIQHRFHVPTFIIISFYFLYNSLIIRNMQKIKDRLLKLLIPYIIYPSFWYIIFNYIYIYFDIESKKFSFKALITQIIIGRGVYGVLWYHFNLIFLTIFSFIISFLFKEHFLFVLQLLAIFSYFIQFSNYNYKFFNKYNGMIKFSVGYLAETIPLAITGLTISSFNMINKLKNIYVEIIINSTLFIFILFKYNIFIPIKGFGKQGLMYNIGGCLFFITFSLIPLDDLNKNILKFISFITNFSPGIYYLHKKVYFLLKNKIIYIKNHSFSGCLLIYLICYLISFIFYNIFKKTKLKYLFI